MKNEAENAAPGAGTPIRIKIGKDEHDFDINNPKLPGWIKKKSANIRAKFIFWCMRLG